MFKQHTLAFQYRFTGQRPHVTQSQYRGAIGDHGHQVALAGVFVRGRRVFGDFTHRFRHAWRIGQRQLGLGAAGLCRCDTQFSRQRPGMIFEGGFFQVVVHGFRLQ